jgi:hypothetical protein
MLKKLIKIIKNIKLLITIIYIHIKKNKIIKLNLKLHNLQIWNNNNLFNKYYKWKSIIILIKYNPLN